MERGRDCCVIVWGVRLTGRVSDASMRPSELLVTDTACTDY